MINKNQRLRLKLDKSKKLLFLLLCLRYVKICVETYRNKRVVFIWQARQISILRVDFFFIFYFLIFKRRNRKENQKKTKTISQYKNN